VQPHQRKDWCVLWLQGWGSDIAGHLGRIQRLAKDLDMPFAMLDYAGHGEHPTPLDDTTREQQHLEVVTVYDELKKQGYKNIIGVGHSFGGYMTALLADKRELAGVILRAPAIYDNETFSTPCKERDNRAYEAMKPTVTADSNFAALDAIRKFSYSVYVLEYELDSVIPRNIPQAYFQVAKYGNYLIVPATDHSPKLMQHPEEHYAYIETLLAGLAKTIIAEKNLR
jgi:pimeloyl-ACP methyl ester carboxylesterase